MNWYKEFGNEWKEIIETVARELGRTELMVEKDTIQSMFLYELSKVDLPFVFKGGTSLSKAYNLIDRFSEDIDLSMNRKPTESERKKSKEYIIKIAESLGLVLSDPKAIRSRHDYNMQARDSRHLYDICKLLKQVKLDDDLDTLIDIVRNDRMFSKNNPSAQLEYNIPDMLKEIIDSRSYESDYKDVTQKLLYEEIGYDDAVKNGIAIVARSDIFLYKKK